MKNKSSLERKKLSILYFLWKVVKAKSNVDGNIDPFLLSVVVDLNVFETFPWVRYTFNDSMEAIRGVTKNMKGFVKPRSQIGFSGFIVPLEILEFECIPHLGSAFREAVPADNECPRMYKHKFTDSCMKGFPLESINEALGSSKDILSILEPDSHEKALLVRIMDDDVDDGICFINPIVEGWRERLLVQRKKIWWRSMFDADLDSRKVPRIENVREGSEIVAAAHNNVHVHASFLSVLQEAIERGYEKMDVKLDDIDAKLTIAMDKLDNLDVKVGDLQNFVLCVGVEKNADQKQKKDEVVDKSKQKEDEVEEEYVEKDNDEEKDMEKENEGAEEAAEMQTEGKQKKGRKI